MACIRVRGEDLLCQQAVSDAVDAPDKFSQTSSNCLLRRVIPKQGGEALNARA
ncbi:hypothetical protein CDEST_05407 [Colletotrichum destructivum]|uniref:Uncharacterized protein n=1 Tax=Colletotrichum destructivum TaxID=34406 RepID=A0AAX4IBM6_9PEZI|nr:hypothetical protein CDEST_05407 [Colletotrichum destructivum]